MKMLSLSFAGYTLAASLSRDCVKYNAVACLGLCCSMVFVGFVLEFG